MNPCESLCIPVNPCNRESLSVTADASDSATRDRGDLGIVVTVASVALGLVVLYFYFVDSEQPVNPERFKP